MLQAAGLLQLLRQLLLLLVLLLLLLGLGYVRLPQPLGCQWSCTHPQCSSSTTRILVGTYTTLIHEYCTHSGYHSILCPYVYIMPM